MPCKAEERRKSERRERERERERDGCSTKKCVMIRRVAFFHSFSSAIGRHMDSRQNKRQRLTACSLATNKEKNMIQRTEEALL
jgi:hypothetical protein